MKYEAIRRQVLDALGQAVQCGLIHGTSGNIAVRDFEENVIAISPSARPYTNMTPEDIAVVTLDGEWIDGPYKPSTETPMHIAVYRARPDVGATVHVHGMFSAIMAMCGDELSPTTPPQAELVPIRVVPFAPPGSDQLAKLVVDTLGDDRVLLLKNHGSFCCGKDIMSAMSAAIYTEEAAQTAYYATLIGKFQPLSSEEITAIKEVMAQYGAV